ncbi:hypothetical protein TraAM80_06839 [Trypanosoma rangeli]|uniref:Uncharacterized protein n=1 Tax=Trypanosoma rangeli TaxID=5698 RepID=A0A3S5IQQ2_TRYRA|nr:uncharacterized protein TraAM80_06839 [Trypanosoma rangeli]RNF01671.1 hypothetical protein TraAM80_06839 [Trypanosoma rangeli]|eukprot:RNF01671.1 hypothetical protein TraAM80_06839 [Trypanosoma rangeli]
MTTLTAAALLHNTATRVTLGNTPLHAVPVTVAQQLKPLLESSTSLTAFTVHTQFTPPESLRLLLLGASRCRSLQHVRLVGGISVLQSKMLMSAFMQFTFARRNSRATSAVRPVKSPAERCPRTPFSKRPSPAPKLRRNAAGCEADMSRNGCHPGGSSRLHLYARANSETSRLPSPRKTWLNGVHMVLDMHHLDDVVAGFLLKGLERSERIVGLDLHIAPTSQAATRAAGRMLSHANAIVARNARRVRYLLCQKPPGEAAPAPRAHQKEKVQLVSYSPLSEDAPKAEYREEERAGEEIRKNEEWRGAIAAVRQELSTFDLHTLPPRRYSPPRLLSGAPPDPPLRPMQPRVVNARLRLFGKADVETEHRPLHDERGGRKGEEETVHDNGCFVCFGEVSHTPEQVQAPNTPRDARRGREEQRGDGLFACPTPGDFLEATQASPSFSRHTPCSPPSTRKQLTQHIRYLHGCVRDINGVVVRYEMASRDSIQRLVTDMRVLEERFTEGLTSKLTDILVSLSEMEKQVE